MKISVDGKELFTLSETQKKVIMNDILEEVFEEDMKRRLKWILIDEKYQKCFKRLKEEWEPKLKLKYPSIPTDDEALAELIFSQPGYKNRSKRESEKIS